MPASNRSLSTLIFKPPPAHSADSSTANTVNGTNMSLTMPLNQGSVYVPANNLQAQGRNLTIPGTLLAIIYSENKITWTPPAGFNEVASASFPVSGNVMIWTKSMTTSEETAFESDSALSYSFTASSSDIAVGLMMCYDPISSVTQTTAFETNAASTDNLTNPNLSLGYPAAALAILVNINGDYITSTLDWNDFNSQVVGTATLSAEVQNFLSGGSTGSLSSTLLQPGSFNRIGGWYGSFTVGLHA